MTINLLSETGTALLAPLIKLGDSAIETIPGIAAGTLVLLVGYLIAVFVGFLVKNGCVKLGFLKKYVKDSSVSKISGKFDLSEFIGIITKWYVFILFMPAAAALIKLGPLADFLLKVSLWLPNLIMALIIAFVGFLGADYISMKIHGTKAKVSGLIASSTKLVIIVFVAIIALAQVGVDVSIAENSFLIILAGVMLALGLSFGLGGRDDAKAILEKLRKNL